MRCQLEGLPTTVLYISVNAKQKKGQTDKQEWQRQLYSALRQIQLAVHIITHLHT